MSIIQEEAETARMVGANSVRRNSVADLPRDRVVMKRSIALKLDGSQYSEQLFDPRPAADDGGLEPSSSPFVSIIIPNFNGIDVLPTVIAALDNQTFRDFETIVVDDASVDDSVSWLEQQSLSVRVIVNRHNEGFAKSCNTGASAARGKLIVMLNSDTEPESFWLREIVLDACAHPEAAIFASKVLLFDSPDTLHTTGDAVGKNGQPINRGVWELDHGQYDECFDVFGGSGCAVAYRRDLWQALGGFDEDFWMYLEDVDFAFRAQLIGARARFVPTARVLHRLTATAGGVLSSYYVGRNSIWLIAKNMPASLILTNCTKIIGAQLHISVEALRNCRGPEARARLKGQALGLFTLKRMLDKRQVIQRRRSLPDAALDRRLYG